MTKRQQSQHSSKVAHYTASPTETWIDRELAGSEFRDARLNQRFRKLFEQLSDGLGGSIPLVCQDWASTKAAYRFLSNQRVTEAEILAGHFQSTRERFAATEEMVLVLHDTTNSAITEPIAKPWVFFTALPLGSTETAIHGTTSCAGFKCIPAWR